MLKALWSWLTGRQNDDFKPTKSDQELMENVRARLTMFGGLEQPVGTVIRTIPGATVRFMELAGMVVPMVYAESNRPVGSITAAGRFVYIQPWKTNA